MHHSKKPVESFPETFFGNTDPFMRPIPGLLEALQSAMPSKGSLDNRMAGIAEELGVAFRALIEPLAGSSPRAADVQEQLGLDKTQSWRVVKLMSSEDPFEALYESPAPKGLEGIARAASAAGASAESVSAAHDAIERYANLIGEFPDGRAGLDAALAAHVPKARDELSRDARRKTAQGMAQIFGVRAAARYSAAILTPSPDDDVSVDVLLVTGYIGFRRLRSGPEPIVFASRHYKPVPGAEPPRTLTLEGGTEDDPRLRYIEAFSTLPASKLDMRNSGDEVRLLLAEGEPGVNEPVTMFFGQRIARALKRSQVDERSFEIVNNLLKSPSDVAVFDTLIHESLYPSADPPTLTIERFGFNPVRQASCFEDNAFRVDDGIEAKSLGKGLARSTSREVPELREVLASVFQRCGLSSEAFRLYRATQVYPLPGFSVVTWLPLEPR